MKSFAVFMFSLFSVLFWEGPALASYRTIARVEVVVPSAWVGSSTYCVVSNGQGFSQFGWANSSGICIAGYFTQPGTYHVTTYHAGKWTQPQPIVEVVDGQGNQIEPAGDSFYLPASSYTVNVLLGE